MFVVFDLDGTLADIRHRVHFVRGTSKPDWSSFFLACVDDVPNWPVVDALKAHLNAGHKVEIWSARNDAVRRETEGWLAIEAGIDPALLTRMRHADDTTPDVVLKRRWLTDLHHTEWPDVVYDDRQRVVDMWREEGIACFQVAANWEADTRTIEPTCRSLLTIMVEPSGGGKSWWADRYKSAQGNWPDMIISSDRLRQQYCGDFRNQSRNDDVFTAMRRIAKARLDSGLPVILDATHLRRRDRLVAAALCPAGAGIRYVVCDRPLHLKHQTAGWRAEVMIDGRPLIDVHHERFQGGLKHILAGDGLPEVVVEDRRQPLFSGLKVGEAA